MSTTSTPPTEPVQAQPLPTRRKTGRWLLSALVLLLLLLLMLGFWLGRESGFQWLARQISANSGLQLERVSGSLYGPMQIGELRWKDAEQSIRLQDVVLDWSPAQLFQGRLTLRSAQVAKLEVQVLAASNKPLTLPSSLKLPLELDVPELRIAQIHYQDGAEKIDLQDLSLALQANAKQWQLKAGQLSTPWGKLKADAQLASSHPFALQGKLSLLHAKGELAAQLDGDLVKLKLNAQVLQAGAPKAQVQALLQPFALLPITQLNVQAQQWNPTELNPAWPKALLSGHLKLNIADDAARSIRGSAQLDNQQIAPLDAQGIPLKHLELDFQGGWPGVPQNLKRMPDLQINQLALDFAAGGQLSGQALAQGQTLTLKLTTKALNLQAFHSRMYASRIAGEIELKHLLASAATEKSKGASQELRVNLAQDGTQLVLQAQMQQQLLQVHSARLQAGKSQIDLQAKLELAGKQGFEATGKVSHFNPAQWGRFPAAEVNGNFDAKGNLAKDWQVLANLAVQNSQLWGQDLRGKGSLRADAKRVQEVALNLQLGSNRLQVNGALGLPQDRLRWQVQAPQLAALQADLSGQINASGEIRGNLQNAASSFKLQAQDLRLGKQLTPALPSSLLQAQGEIGLRPPFALQMQGSSQGINPAAFGAFPSAVLNSDFSLKGQIASDWQAGPWQAKLQLKPESSWAKAPLAGQLGLQMAAGRLSQVEIALQVGQNQLQAHGSLGQLNDRLEWQLQAPQLAQFDPRSEANRLSGKASANGVLSGTWQSLGLQAQAQLQDLKLTPTQTIKNGQLQLNWPSRADQALQLDLNLKEVQAGNLQLALLQAQASGTRSAHSLRLSARGDELDSQLELRGGIGAGRQWQGKLVSASNRGRIPVQLQAPASVLLAFEQASWVLQQLQVQNLAVDVSGGKLQVTQLEHAAGRWQTKGQVTQLPLGLLLPDAVEDLRSDLLLAGSWNLEMGSSLNGKLLLARESGDLRIAGSSAGPLGLQTLQAQLDLQQGLATLRFDLASRSAGRMQLEAQSRLQQQNGVWGLAGSSPLQLRSDASLTSIAWLAPLFSIPDLELGGALEMAVTGTGSVAAPQLSGQIKGEQLALRWPDLGLKLRNGQLRANLAQDQLNIQSLRVEGGQGSAQAQGWLKFAEQTLRMQLNVQADHLQVLARPDRQLVMSGNGRLLIDKKQVQLDGKFIADSAEIELATQTGPSFSEDVVIVGATPKQAKSAALPLTVDVEFDLGENFKLRGSGLQAQLTGALRIKAFDRRGPRATGSIAVQSGNYSAYGQKLQIERGVLNFSGALDNPGINLLAVRKPQDAETGVEAGIELRGTLQAPQARLVSTPSVPDSEKLAWLVLGHGSEGGGDKDNQLLGLAANALFGGAQSNKLASVLALDEINLSRASGVETAVVSVGKRLSSKAFLTFEQGSGAASTLIKLRYTFNPRLSVQVQTGNNNAVDAFYTWRFD